MDATIVEGTSKSTSGKSKEDGVEKTWKNMLYYSKIEILLQNITIEPIMVCAILPNLMSVITTQNLTLEKSCRVNLALDEKICDALSIRNSSYPDYKAHEATVQRLAANLTVWKSVIQSLFPSILLLFLGAWSDRHLRRKPLILNVILGEICACLCLLLCALYFYVIPLEFVILAESLPTVFTGGWPALFLGVFSYIGNVSTEETRTVRIGAVHTLYTMSCCIGISLSGLVFLKLGFKGVYILALCIYLSGFFYGCFFVKDVRDLQENRIDIMDEKKPNFCIDFFNFKQMGQTLKLFFKKDNYNRRKKMCCILILTMINTGPFIGEVDIVYYYVRYKLGWSGLDFSMFSVFLLIIKVTGSTLILTFLAKLLKIDDNILGMISSASRICGVLVYAFAPNSIIFYLGAVVEMFSGVAYISVRSIASKTVGPEELGAVIAVLGCADTLIPLIYGPLYSKIYAATLNIFPGTCYLITAACTVPTLCIFLWLYLEKKKIDAERLALKSQKDALMENDSGINSENLQNLKEK